MKAYHFLKDDMCGGYGSEKHWKVGEERDIGDNNLKLCERGYHSSPSWYDALGYARGNMACIVKVSRPIQKDETKFVSRKRKLLDARNAEKTLRAWGCDCAERALRRAKITDKRSWNAIKIARLFNEGKATKEELAAADSAAGLVAYSAACWAAYSVADEELAAADSAADSAVYLVAYSAACWAACWAAYSVADSAACWAAYSVADSAACWAEIKWQKRRLNWYMKRLFANETKLSD